MLDVGCGSGGPALFLARERGCRVTGVDVNEVGLKRVIEEVGPERVLQEVDLNKIIEEMGPDWLLARLTPEHRRQLQQRLQ